MSAVSCGRRRGPTSSQWAAAVPWACWGGGCAGAMPSGRRMFSWPPITCTTRICSRWPPPSPGGWGWGRCPRTSGACWAWSRSRSCARCSCPRSPPASGGEPDPHGPLHSACTDLLEHLGLEDEVRFLTDPDFHGSRTPPPEAPGEPGDDGPGPADEGAIAQAARRSAHFMRRAAAAAAPLAGNPDVVALIEGWLGTWSGEHYLDSLRAAYMLPDDDLLALVPVIVRWVDVDRVAPHPRRLLCMLPVGRLRPVLVPAVFSRLREDPEVDDLSWWSYADLLDDIGLKNEVRRIADLALTHEDRLVRAMGKEIVENFLQD